MLVQYFNGDFVTDPLGPLPYSEYLWAIVIVAVSITGFIVARKMVSKV